MRGAAHVSYPKYTKIFHVQILPPTSIYIEFQIRKGKYNQ